MANPIVWPKPPQCSKADLNRAGAGFMELFAGADTWDLVNRWRASHGFPLNSFQVGLRYRAHRLDKNAVVAQRLKRLFSIQAKLQREDTMRLSQMQDIGGCRAVVRTVTDVRRLTDIYLEDDAFKLRNNYILRPKEDGYRSIHVIGSYRSDDSDYSCWNGHRIELQLRSQLQHAWATALEVVMTFTNQALKFGEGDEDWRRFFVLMGSAIAEREVTPLAKDAKLDIAELRDLAVRLRVLTRLDGWRAGMKFMPKRRMVKAEAWLLILNPTVRTLKVHPFRTLAEAAAESSKLEKNKQLDVVQVNAESLDELRSGYRNYYADTQEFLGVVRKAIA